MRKYVGKAQQLNAMITICPTPHRFDYIDHVLVIERDWHVIAYMMTPILGPVTIKYSMFKQPHLRNPTHSTKLLGSAGSSKRFSVQYIVFAVFA